MSRIVNIGDFYRVNTSFPSVIESIEIPGGEVITYRSYSRGEVISSPESGATGPIEITSIVSAPSVGQYVRFFTEDANTEPYLVISTGSTDETNYFNIAEPLTVSSQELCFVYLATGTDPVNDIIRTLRIVQGNTGDTQITTGIQIISGVSYLTLAGEEPLRINNAINSDTGATIFMVEPLQQNYDGYTHSVQRRTTSTGAGNFVSNGNSHAKRQFGNHPRIQRA